LPTSRTGACSTPITAGHSTPSLIRSTRSLVSYSSSRLMNKPQFLHNLYKRKLAEVCGFRYVQSFGMIGNNGHLSYYLMHGTNHIKGASLMKDAMWKIDPGGGCTFSDRMANQDVLFQAEPNFRPLRDGLLSSFAGRTVGIAEIEDWVIVDTPYRGAHLRRPVLTPLEKAGLISVKRPGKSGFPDETTLTFP
jgi:hypothetical protein